ncbi:hypothetical protein SD10_27170 [Spirosoma radiotolerans]|uniref:Uncharacterized protein n=2 Tax=Spirosoma radiotolerans TaxID=1379870 RepID=A0A0E4A0C4_9BACT|nr:hypothetical protein SD10_27170 [Spirosoma radiotolerans]
MHSTQYIMKKIALSVIGGSLFVAGYYHVHRHSAYVDTKPTQTALETTAKPATVFPFKTLPAFALRTDKYFTF